MSKVAPQVTVIVPARAGSKGLENKNVRTLGGMPLYLRAVRQGISIGARVLLSTDIAHIHQEDLPKGCTLCARPGDLAHDETPMARVVEHLIETQGLDGQTIVLLQPTSPLRSHEDIAATMGLYAEGDYDMVLTVAERDRGCLKWGMLQGTEFRSLQEPRFCFSNRQALPPVYGPNGAVYVFAASRFVELGAFPTQRIGAVVMPAERSLDIDTEDDLHRAEQMLQTMRD